MCLREYIYLFFIWKQLIYLCASVQFDLCNRPCFPYGPVEAYIFGTVNLQ